MPRATKKRRMPKIEFRNTNEVVREESSFMDFFLVVVIITVVAPICVYLFG